MKSRRGYYVTALTESTIAEGYDVRLALELQAAEAAVGRAGRDGLRRFRDLHERTVAAVSHTEWDEANAAFHEHQVDLAGNDVALALLPRAVGQPDDAGDPRRQARGRRRTSRPSTRRSWTRTRPATCAAAHAAIRAHIATGRRIALDAIETAGGLL